MVDARNFSVYEFAGVLAPGTILLLILGLSDSRLDLTPTLSKYSFAGVLLFLIVAYVAGQLVQALGNVLEGFVWSGAGGWPTDWVRSRKHHLLADEQRIRLASLAKSRVGVDLNEITAADWRAIGRQIYALVQAEQGSALVDRFNATYGLLRGVAAATLVGAVVTAVTSWPNHIVAAVLLGGAAVLALLRMVRFGRYYAQELFVRFLQLKPAAGSSTGSKPNGING